MKELIKLFHNKEELRKICLQFFKFGIIGFSNTLISLAAYYFFIFFISTELYIAGYTVGFVLGVLNSYYWNNKYVFKKKEKGNIKPLIRCFIAYSSTYFLGLALLYILINILHVSDVIAPLINLFVTVPINFLLNKYWAFR